MKGSLLAILYQGLLKFLNLRTRTVILSINVSFDDKKITGLKNDTHDSLPFTNEVVKFSTESNTDDASNIDGKTENVYDEGSNTKVPPSHILLTHQKKIH